MELNSHFAFCLYEIIMKTYITVYHQWRFLAWRTKASSIQGKHTQMCSVLKIRMGSPRKDWLQKRVCVLMPDMWSCIMQERLLLWVIWCSRKLEITPAVYTEDTWLQKCKLKLQDYWSESDVSLNKLEGIFSYKHELSGSFFISFNTLFENKNLTSLNFALSRNYIKQSLRFSSLWALTTGFAFFHYGHWRVKHIN